MGPSSRGRKELHRVRYVQLNINRLMNSAGLCAARACRAWWGPDRRASAAHNFSWCGGSQVGEPVEQSGVLVPFGQVVGDDVGVGGFEGFAFGLGGGASVDIGGG